MCGRMPPARNTSRSNGVSIRARIVNSRPSASTVTSSGSGRRRRARPGREMRYTSWPVSPSDRRRVAGRGTRAGSTPIPTRFERWMRSKLSTSTARTPSSSDPFAAQSRDEPDAVLLAREHDERHAFVRVPHRGVVDRHLLAVGRCSVKPPSVPGASWLRMRDVGERAAHHHLVVAAARAVRVEVARLDAVLDRATPPAGRRRADVARRRDVIGRDAVAEQREHARAVDIVQRRAAAARCPRGTAGGGCTSSSDPIRSGRRSARARPRQRSSPSRIERVALDEHRRVDRLRDDVRRSPASVGPKVAQVHGLAVRVVPIGSLSRSMSIVPASVYATTSGGDAR